MAQAPGYAGSEPLDTNSSPSYWLTGAGMNRRPKTLGSTIITPPLVRWSFRERESLPEIEAPTPVAEG